MIGKPDRRPQHQHALIQAKAIRKSFGSHEVLKGVDLAAATGDVVTLIGSSGSGKSTFIRCLNFLEEPTSGQVIVGNEVFQSSGKARRTAHERARLVRLRQRVGMVFQAFNLWPHRTALGNITEGPIHARGLAAREAESKGKYYLDKVGLGAKAGAYPAELSGGQQQRVAIARALAMEPDVILFDEPTSALDPELVGEVLGVMKALAAEGRTMIIVTHEMQFAREVSSETLFLSNGEITERGRPDDVFGSPQSLRLRSFLARYSG
ncbi:amino acid ABC transporter ATP-binding protein [Mesorhizobium sp. B2-4-6]|uniref:amino acid ABC transporter ATP-binding protein n=1 Tax=Mesorhizobium sp. B2-4-6 TaxID=2589943 RepID=UPI0011263B7C|nr:amino acid ABC transporter ATP-binding protein [Mesorhizobium sp. B2-4-6]TPL43523.1 amino acid ABC transporter ATP-binding protein [Mesorhizobium sp. B2-4-6]